MANPDLSRLTIVTSFQNQFRFVRCSRKVDWISTQGASTTPLATWLGPYVAGVTTCSWFQPFVKVNSSIEPFSTSLAHIFFRVFAFFSTVFMAYFSMFSSYHIPKSE